MNNSIPAIVTGLLGTLLIPYFAQCQTRTPIQLPQSVQADSTQHARVELQARLKANDAMLRQRFRRLFSTTPAVTTSARAGAPAPPPDDPLARDQLEVLRTMDPATQTVPPERLKQARQEVQRRIRTNDFASALPPTAT